MFPQAFAAAFFLQNRLEQLAGELLGLVEQKGQHHQHGEGDGKMMFAMTKVVFKVVALILECIEGFVLNLPTGSSTPHDEVDIPLADSQIGHP